MENRPSRTWIFDLLLIIVLAIGGYFRIIGLDWDQGQHLHPDERFLTMVSSAIEPVKSFSEYFDTANSSLNPPNRGYGFFVYGTLPIFIVRYAAEWTNMAGYDQVYLVGRVASAIVDLLAVLLLYIIAARLYNRRVALLAAAFSAFAVMQIQQSHFFTVDNFPTLFGMLTAYFAVEILLEDGQDESRFDNIASIFRSSLFLNAIGFGLALGMAVASKLNAAPLAILLPGAFLIRHFRLNRRPAADAAVSNQSLPAESAADPQPETENPIQGEAVDAVEESAPADVVPPLPSHSKTFEFALLMVVIGALVSILAFRLFQPYAFSGPGFFGLKPNPQWVQNIADQRAQASGDVDFPPALQWARRSAFFSMQNIIQWGLGWPLGILAFAGMLYMGWRSLKGEWQTHLLLWGWTVFYFAWQSMQWNPVMRYQLPIYPLLALMAAWLVVEMAGWKIAWPKSKSQTPDSASSPSTFDFRPFAFIVGAVVLLTTFAWAYAFTRIYTRDHTRVQATRWIYQNVPGPINARITTADGSTVNVPIPYSYNNLLVPSTYEVGFKATADGTLNEVFLPHVRAASATQTLQLTISALPNGESPLTQATLVGDFSVPGNTSVPAFDFQPQAIMETGAMYYVSLRVLDSSGLVDICAPLQLYILDVSGTLTTPIQFNECILNPGQMVETSFFSPGYGPLTSAIAQRLVVSGIPRAKESTMTVSVSNPNATDSLGASASITSSFAPGSDSRGTAYSFKLENPLKVVKDEFYTIRMTVMGNPLTIGHVAPVNEASWDDGLPLRMDGYDGYGGMYQGELNFEMYWDDNTDKLNRFVNNLDAGDYLFISSNRQWATTVRVPERYPLTTEYYRNLIGCPAEKDIIWCYNVARPGMFGGNLGYELVQVFESYPTLGQFEINDQFADESFTVYDHTKVLIFKKSADYNPQVVRNILGKVDLTQTVHLTPRRASSFPGLLTLPADKLAIQRAGGTWSELFSYDALINQYPVLGLLLWYLTLSVLGLFAYPLVRLVLPGLSDRGYPFSRLAGLLMLSYFAWAVGSLGGEYSRLTIAAGFGAISVAGAAAAYLKRDELRAEINARGRDILIVEAIFLALFLIDLLIRIGNPDLWHPAKGGERPMDFSYLNAVIKSTTFPPYDPWYAGGYINYYYWGFVLVGTPIKLLGIVPTIAYNFVLPTLFAMLGIGGFSLAWNLVEGQKSKADDIDLRPSTFDLQLISGLAASAGLVLLGNLGTVRMIFRGLQKLTVPNEMVDSTAVWFYERWAWAAQGLIKVIGGQSLPYGWGEWYWQPSRVIPAPGEVEPITEFPLFTFLYSDLHAHMIALPLAVLALAWALSTLMARNQSRWTWLGTLAFGGLIIGSLRPTNTWDFPTYLLFGALITGYTIFRYVEVGDSPRYGLSPFIQRGILALAGMAALAAFSLIFFEPFARWYGLGYSQVAQWTGTKTPIWSYWTHWGLFLFVIIAWMSWETRQWLAQTPLSALSKLKPYELLIEAAIGLLVVAVIGLTFMLKIQVAWFILPLAFWALVLLLRPNLPDAKRMVLFMIGTGLTLTLVVEIIVLVGDISRMNTVFKFYLQVWVLFAISAAAGLGWILNEFDQWNHSWQNFFQTVGGILLLCAMMFTVTATSDKIRDRMAEGVPLTLDSITYMQYSKFWDGVEMNLKEDYNAIRWLQDNVKGSPVTVEASIPEYRWGTRMTIYTGLPTVLGWNWHQRQQRAILPDSWIFQRSDEIKNFYLTSDMVVTRNFIEKYDVKYIIVGQNERQYFPGPGLDKFPALDGQMWNKVFEDGNTVIYEVK
jgi:YYY domain-containing protein